nr:RluA family pseudouridine synthase [Ureaplasma sp.]
MKKIIVKENDVGKRLDNFLTKMYPHISKVLFIKWIRNKDIKINNKRCQFNDSLNLNDEITIFFDKYLANKISKNDFMEASDKLDIIYEDKNIIITNKPIGLLSHNDDNQNNDTIINRIKKHLANSNEWDYQNENSFSPSLINRIDYNTSGIVVAAKNANSLRLLNDIFKNREIEKRYYCLLHSDNIPKEWQTINLYIDDRTEIVKVYDNYQLNTKIAITKFRGIKAVGNYFLVEVVLITGRKHQIRATFNFLDIPLVGEQKYTKKEFNDKKYKTQFLVSYFLKFKISDSKNPLFYLNKLEFKLKDIWF